MVAAVGPPPVDPSQRLARLRADMDELADRHCRAQQGGGAAPDLSPLHLCVAEAESLLEQLRGGDAVQACYLIGCGWHMLGNDDRALEPLLAVCRAQDGAMPPQQQLSAIMVALPMLKKKQSWALVSRTCDKAQALAGGRWAHFTLPYMKGLAMASLNRPEQAAELFEQAIAMSPGWSPAYVEFDKAATAMRDFERCRQVAQKLVEHGGSWVNCWQRPDHFLTDLPVTSKPWHDAADFPLARLLEENFAVIKAELEAMADGQWGRVGSSDRGNENSAHDSDLVTGGEWSEIVLLGDSEVCAEHCRRCPETTRLLQGCPEAAGCAAMRLGESLFSRLKPGTQLRPHCGPTNMRLTCHLGLSVPEGCSITCGGEERTWQEGKCIVFDDSFEHEVRHDGTAARSVLLVNFWHPDIPSENWKAFTDRLKGSSGQEDPCQSLLAAVRAAGGVASEKLMRGKAPPLHVPGVLAAAPIAAGELLCRVPAELCVAQSRLAALLPEQLAALEAAEQLPAARRLEALQASFLCRLLEGTAERPPGLDEGTWEVWQRWAQLLKPEDFAFHPYRREAEVAPLLAPSPEAGFFPERAREMRALHQVVAQASQGPPLPLESFLRARLCMLTRSFAGEEPGTLVPLVDLFNHGSSPAQRCVSWSWEEGAMVVRSTRRIEVGEELLFAYGARSNVLLYRTYGFTVAPAAEAAWSFALRPALAAPVFEEFLPGQNDDIQVLLHSDDLDASLCRLLNACPKDGAAAFLTGLCHHCQKPYKEDEGLRDALDALRRARSRGDQSAAWWSELPRDGSPGDVADALRVKMSEYLCLQAHLDVLEVLAGTREPTECLPGTERLRESLGEALRILGEGREVAVERVPGGV